MKKVLIITYYWPPSGGAGVQRWLKFSKYLPKYGWQPIIYTPENPDFTLQDNSLAKDIPKEAIVLKQKIWEPYGFYKALVGQKGKSANAGFFAGDKRSWKQRLSIFIRGQFFIPDPRVFWVKPSIKYLSKYLIENPVDAIVSTGPPHSMHLIALGLKKKFPEIKWILDFRDPWTDIDFYKDLHLSKWADKKHHKLESEVVKSADKIVTVSKSWAEELTKNHNRKVEVITNGFDVDDFKELKFKNNSNDFTIVHLGSMNKDRNPDVFWKVIAELNKIGTFVKVQLIGQIDETVKQSIVRFNLEKNILHIPYLKHKEALQYAKNANILLLSVNNTPNLMGVIPGKLFEYLALNKVILNIGPEKGNSAQIINDAQAGKTFNFDEEGSIKQFILECYNSKDEFMTENKLISKYSREVLTQQLAKLL